MTFYTMVRRKKPDDMFVGITLMDIAMKEKRDSNFLIYKIGKDNGDA